LISFPLLTCVSCSVWTMVWVMLWFCSSFSSKGSPGEKTWGS